MRLVAGAGTSGGAGRGTKWVALAEVKLVTVVETPESRRSGGATTRGGGGGVQPKSDNDDLAILDEKSWKHEVDGGSGILPSQEWQPKVDGATRSTAVKLAAGNDEELKIRAFLRIKSGIRTGKISLGART